MSMITLRRFATVTTVMLVVSTAAMSGSSTPAFSETVPRHTELVFGGLGAAPSRGTVYAGLPQCAACDQVIVEDFSGNWVGSYILYERECDGFDWYCYPCTGFGAEQCRNAGPYQHFDFSDSTQAQQWVWNQEGCGTCENDSQIMIPELIEFAAVNELAHIIEASKGRVWLNRERSAIQGLGCGDVPGMHLPISIHLADFISEVLSVSPGSSSHP
jgi:hypothetical protein